LGSALTTQKNQSESPATTSVPSLVEESTTSVSTQTDVSDLLSVSETHTVLLPLQPVPYVKNALRASKFNWLKGLRFVVLKGFIASLQ